MFLGLDLGTSGLKALLVDQGGAIIGSATADYDVSHPHQGWSEQKPADWAEACHSVMRSLVAQFPDQMGLLQAIGTSGHMHGATLLGRDGSVLRPCILWNDVRSHKEAAELDAKDRVRDLSGNIVFPGFTAPKLMWVAKHEPGIFAQIATVLLPKDYLNYWLTDVLASDMSDSAGTSWLDVGAREWSDDLLTASGMSKDQMPALFEGCEVIGTIKASLASEWGIPANTKVVAGGGDNAVSACGVGALSEGQGFVSLGTSGVLLAAKDSFAPDAETAVHTFCHAVPNRWYQMGVILAATDSLNWLSRQLEKDAGALSSALGDSIASPGQVKFLPYLSGERTPHNDSSIRGALINLDVSHEQEDLTRAVMEGVAFALRDSLEALRSTGTKLTRALVIGGGSQSTYWVELLATVLNMPLDLPAKGEFGASLGAARLAQIGSTGVPPETVIQAPPIAKAIEPRQDLTAEYEAAYQEWRKIYPSLKALT